MSHYPGHRSVYTENYTFVLGSLVVYHTECLLEGEAGISGVVDPEAEDAEAGDEEQVVLGLIDGSMLHG